MTLMSQAFSWAGAQYRVVVKRQFEAWNLDRELKQVVNPLRATPNAG